MLGQAKFLLVCGRCGEEEQVDVFDALPSTRPIRLTTRADFYWERWQHDVQQGTGWHKVRLARDGMVSEEALLCPVCWDKCELAGHEARLAALRSA